MQLLVSVATEQDAAAAIDGGADWIDAKDPSQGPLGRVTVPQLHRIAGVVGGLRPISAALGDVDDEAEARRLTAEYSRCGVILLKIGLGYLTAAADVARLSAAAVDALGPDASRIGIVAVAYADENIWGTMPAAFVAAAARGGATGVLLDTARKRGSGLCSMLSLEAISAWVSAAHGHGLLMAVAGRLTANDLLRLSDCGADIAGVRGAVCRGGRTGSVVAGKVIEVLAACRGRDRQARQSA